MKALYIAANAMPVVSVKCFADSDRVLPRVSLITSRVRIFWPVNIIFVSI